jgi:hypothetical protein
LTRPDGRVAQIRRRGSAVAIADGAPEEENWADAILDAGVAKRPPAVKSEESRGPLSLLVQRRETETNASTRVLGGLIAAHRARASSSSFSLLGGLLADVNSTCDGTRVSLLFGLVSWRTAPRQDLFNGRFLISTYAADSESVAWWLLPIVNAPGYIRALGHHEIRTGLWNLDSTLKVTFDPAGVPTEGNKIGSDGSVILGLFGRGWYDDQEPDGTPVKSSSWYGPFPIGFSTTTQTRGPLGPAYAVKPESRPASGPESRARIRLQPGDVESYSHTQVLGDLLFSHDTTSLTRGGEALGDRANWSLLFGLLASGGTREGQWWFRNPLVGWAELTDQSYVLLFWGFVPILVSSSEPPVDSRPETAPVSSDVKP